jgi:copper chaperone CopZ
LGIKFLILAVTAVASCFGQLRSVEIGVSGLNCASCAGAVEPRLKRMRGVASAKFDFDRGLVSITLNAENRVTLSLIRDSLKMLGYTPGDADVVVIGDAKDGRLSLPSQMEEFVLEKPDSASGRVRVEGTVPAGMSTLRVRSATKQE